jgi:primosomal protein N'
MFSKKRKSYGVKKIEDKYVCEECQAEVPIRQACPVCKKEIDWDRVFEESKLR